MNYEILNDQKQKVGHSYWGRGRVIEQRENELLVLFDFIGLKTVKLSEIQIVPKEVLNVSQI